MHPELEDYLLERMAQDERKQAVAKEEKKTTLLDVANELQRLREIEKQHQWRPMSTAPRDGTEVILVVEKRAGIPHQQLVGHWMPGGHCIEDHPPIAEGWYFWNGCMFDKASKPLAWMPSPVYKPEEKKSG